VATVANEAPVSEPEDLTNVSAKTLCYKNFRKCNI